jgi:hypothetical protein
VHKESELKIFNGEFEKNAKFFQYLKNKLQSKTYDWAKSPMMLATAPLALGGALYGVGEILDTIGKSKADKKTKEKIISTANRTLEDEEFKNRDRDQVVRRIGEISSFAPTVSQSQLMTKSILRNTLDRDLRPEDIEKILDLEIKSNKAIRPYPGTPLGRFLKSDTIQKTYDPVLKLMAQEFVRKTDEHLNTQSPFAQRPRGPSPGVEVFTRKKDEPLSNVQRTNRHDLENLAAQLKQYEKKFKGLPEEFSGVDLGTTGGMLAASGIMRDNPSLTKRMNQKMEKSMKKESSFKKRIVSKKPSYWKKFINPLLAATGIGAGFGVVQETAKYKQQVKDNEKIRQSWDSVSDRLLKMKKGDVTNRNYKNKDDMNQARTVFKSLASFAPSIAKDPVLGASIVNNILVQSGNIEPATLKTLVDIQKNINQIQEFKSPFAKNPFAKGFEHGFGLSGGGEMVKEIAKSAT